MSYGRAFALRCRMITQRVSAASLAVFFLGAGSRIATAAPGSAKIDRALTQSLRSGARTAAPSYITRIIRPSRRDPSRAQIARGRYRSRAPVGRGVVRRRAQRGRRRASRSIRGSLQCRPTRSCTRATGDERRGRNRHRIVEAVRAVLVGGHQHVARHARSADRLARSRGSDRSLASASRSSTRASRRAPTSRPHHRASTTSRTAAVPAPPYDDYGHGTHVAGLIGSERRAVERRVPGRRAGRAARRPEGARRATARGKTSDVIKRARVRHREPGALGVAVINLSLGHPIFEPATTDPLVQAVEKAVRRRHRRRRVRGQLRQQPDDRTAGLRRHHVAGQRAVGASPSARPNTQDTVDRGDDDVSRRTARAGRRGSTASRSRTSSRPGISSCRTRARRRTSTASSRTAASRAGERVSRC